MDETRKRPYGLATYDPYKTEQVGRSRGSPGKGQLENGIVSSSNRNKSLDQAMDSVLASTKAVLDPLLNGQKQASHGHGTRSVSRSSLDSGRRSSLSVSNAEDVAQVRIFGKYSWGHHSGLTVCRLPTTRANYLISWLLQQVIWS